MRIRVPFAIAFALLILLAAYLGLLPHSAPNSWTPYTPNDKFLHLAAFFLLTLSFYFILDTSRRRVLNLSLLVCTFALGVGSEFVQGFLANGREFDIYDVIANVVGSLGAIGLASWYHKRMLERRRKAKYGALGAEGEEDVELGEGGLAHRGDNDGQETGIISRSADELDNWDENAEDAWDDEDDGGGGERAHKMTPTSSSAGDDVEGKKAVD